MKLVKPSLKYDKQIQAYRKEFLDSGDSMDGTGGLRQFDKTLDWIEHRKTYNDLIYMFVREEDDKIVGMIQIRPLTNDYLKKFGGHIGYSVAPSERQKGYATEMLKIALQNSRELGIDKLLVTCIQGNQGSKKTILNNGGVYESTVHEPDDGIDLERYWIDLSN